MKNSKEYLDKVSKIIEPPYFYEMENYGIDGKEEWEYILGKIYGDYIRISLNYGRNIFDSKGNRVYKEYSTGNWTKWGYDNNGNMVFQGK